MEAAERYGARNSWQNFLASQILEKLQERVYRSWIHDVDQLNSHLIAEWEHFHQVFIDEATGSGVHVFKLAFKKTRMTF